MNKLTLIFFLLIVSIGGFCQGRGDLLNRIPGVRNLSSNSSSKDTIGFEHRDNAKDSISISYRYLDSLRNNKFDSSINDFYKYYAAPYNWQYLGNTGAAGYWLTFLANTKTGLDPGFHSFDAYKYMIENSRFFKTSKPFTQLSYQLAGGKEQMIKILHTQNPRANLNFGFEYRLINGPGFFVNQHSNHSNYRLFSNYQGKRKRYAASFIFLGNTIKNSENGGMVSNAYLDTPIYNRRFSIPVNFSFSTRYTPNPFNTFISTGHLDKELTFYFKQHYDIGKKDSVEINDSTTEYLFYSKLRFQHTFSYINSSYTFIDTLLTRTRGGNSLDSAIYKDWYDTTINKTIKRFQLTDAWRIYSNDFSILQFPDTKNQGQYILAGVKLESIKGTTNAYKIWDYNIILHGEYRNKTKNKLWDILAKGEFYLKGMNFGDYSIHATLSRFFNNKWGNVTLSFQNINRTPSFVFNKLSSFNFNNNLSLSKENIIVAKASAENQFINLSATNYLITNYSHFTGHYKTAQFNRVINLLQFGASKKIKITKRWSLYSEAMLQLTDAAAPIKLPLAFTRNRLAYEGLFFKNLNLCTGIEVKYFTPFKMYDYSPVMGQFFPQDTVKQINRPDVNAFLHFRIRSFTAYVRAENLNTIDFSNGFGFTKSNFAAPNYIYPSLMIRFGIQWNFVN